MARHLLDQVKVASPCHVSWAEMTGDERVRFCGHCKLNVFNLSDMTDGEAEALLRKTNGRLCVRYYQRADGTVMTRNCPVGMAAVRRRFAIGLVSAAALLVTAFGLAVRPATSLTTSPGPPKEGDVAKRSTYMDTFIDWLAAQPEEPRHKLTYTLGMRLAPAPRTNPSIGP